MPNEKEEVEALRKFKASQLKKHPDGNIPADKIRKFEIDRKRAKFKELVKQDLFLIIFRDSNLMSALDRAMAEEKKFKAAQKQFLPLIEEKKYDSYTVKNPNLLKPEISKAVQFESPNKGGKAHPGISTKALDFKSEDFFMENKIVPFYEKKASPQRRFKKSSRKPKEPVLDKKNRLNEAMCQEYPGML